MLEELTFRKSRKEDMARISEFRKSFFPYNSSIRCREPEYYEWKCYKNPFQQGEMWLAEDGNKIVAIKNITPKRMKILGAIAIVGEIGDSFTHHDYQRPGIFTALSKVARESALNEGISLIYSVPSRKTLLPGYLKKSNQSPVPINLHRLVKTVAPKINVPLSFLGFFLSSIIEIASEAMLRIGNIGIPRNKVFICHESSFPDDIDNLWEQASRNYDVLLVRKKKYLEWRYVTNPDAYHILIARNLNRAILGYMVTKIGSSGNRQLGFIVDFLTIEDDPNIFTKLLTASLEEFYRRKVNTVSTWAITGSYYNKSLLRFGFLPSLDYRIPLLCYKNDLGPQVLGKAYKWHFTMGDTDNI